MRLIDTDKLKKDILLQNILGEPIQKIIDRYIHIVDEQPTAFDADKVVQQLEILIEDKCSESGDDWYTAECLNEAVEIVKSGGIKWVD